MKWAEIEIRCPPASVDAVSALLTAVGCGGTAIRDGETGPAGSGQHPTPDTQHPAAVIGYLPVDDRLEGSLNELRERIRELPTFGLEVEDGLTLRTVQDQDWESAWK